MEKSKTGSRIESIFLKTWRPYAWIVLAIILLYSKALFFGFTYFDDDSFILKNYYFNKDIGSVFRVFFQDHFISNRDVYYRPLVNISYIIDAQFAGTGTFGYHLTNILFHIIASCLLFACLLQIKYQRGLSFIFSLFFAVHPLQVQAVAWIPGRNDSLLAVFILLTFLFFLMSIETKKVLYTAAHFICFALAVFTKESGILIALLCFIYLYFIYKEKRTLLSKIILPAGWAAIFTAWLIMRHIAFTGPVTINPVNVIKTWLLNIPAAIQFLGKIVFPFNLSVVHVMADTTFIYGIIALFLVSAAVILTRRKRRNYIFLSLGWFGLFLAPMFIWLNPQGELPYFLEHRMYLPMIGFIIIMLETGLAGSLIDRKKPVLIMALLILIIFSVLTFIHTDVFRDRLSFWQSAVRTAPHLPLAHFNLGVKYSMDGMYNNAEAEFKEALRLNPKEKKVHNNLGMNFFSQKRYKEAEAEYLKELKIYPSNSVAHHNLGILYYKTGRKNEAVSIWQKALIINPEYINLYKYLAVHYFTEKDYSKMSYYVKHLQKKGIPIPPQILKKLR
ncbi:tetratricopeptide repeat protein [Candidatus Margulisiibacteriota bacterium]